MKLGFLLLLCIFLPGNAAGEERRSGYEFMSRETQAMQDDDATNPAAIWLLDGQALWAKRAGKAGMACTDCHGAAEQGMKGVAARYPAYDAKLGRLLNLEQRINACRTGRQQAPALQYESRDLLSLSVLVARQSRGFPIAVSKDAEKFLESGRRTYLLRQGQINLSCASCHDQNAGRSLAGAPIPQAHPTGYPLYRLEWQAVGSLQRRLRNCLTGMRAQSYDFGAPELVEIELYLMQRAAGMNMESPAVRP